MDVLYRDLLLTFPAMAIERFEQRYIGPRELICLVQVLTPSLEGLFADHGTPVALHRGIVGGD